MKSLWVKNTEGRPDSILTFTLIGFIIVIVKVLFSGLHVELEGAVYKFGEIDAATIGSILTPTLGAYVSKKFVDRKYSKKSKETHEPKGPNSPGEE